MTAETHHAKLITELYNSLHTGFKRRDTAAATLDIN